MSWEGCPKRHKSNLVVLRKPRSQQLLALGGRLRRAVVLGIRAVLDAPAVPFPESMVAPVPGTSWLMPRRP